jgi:PAS domain S-box-containing protein
VFRKKKPFREYIHRNVRKDGTTVWLATSGVPILSDTGELLGYRGADADITEGRRAGRELEAERDHLARMLNSIHEGVLATDPDGKIVLFNKSAEHLTGRLAGEAVGRPLGEVFPLQSGSTSEDLVTQILRSPDDANLSGTGAFTRRDGEKVSLGFSAAGIRDKNDEVAGVVIVFSGIEEAVEAPEGAGTS